MGTSRSEGPDPLECPFSCGYKHSQYYALAFHVESVHTEGSPFVADGGGTASDVADCGDGDESDNEFNTYTVCPEDDCGETMLLIELQNHMDMHGAERIAMNELGETNAPQMASSASEVKKLKRSKSPGKSKKEHKSSSDKSKSSKGSSSSSKSTTDSSSQGRRGRRRRSVKSELGPYASEKQMPPQLYEQLVEGPRIIYENRIGPNGVLIRTTSVANETPHLVPLIAQLLERDSTVARAWLCDSGVRHICKQLPREGGFCGYRNIQMLISHMQARYPRGTHPFTGLVPTIIKIQHDIERGWNMGINMNGKIETGGILGTRKYIGTSEAETYFKVQNIPCTPHCITKRGNDAAYEYLFSFVEGFYECGRTSGATDRILRTTLPPIYFQHAGHSMTIIGLEKRLDGTINLLVFDPTFSTSPAMLELIGAKKIKSKVKPENLLKAHRRGPAYLSKYNEFELLLLR